MVFVTGDLHLFHTNIIQLKNRPFVSISEMNAELIKRWNKTISTNDTVYVVGDFIGKESVNGSEIQRLGNSLNGNKILLKGNHDKDYPMEKIFSKVYNANTVVTIEYNNTYFHLNHFFDNLSVIDDFPNVMYLHGHKHNKIGYNVLNQFYKRPYFDVGVDANDFTPISLEAIIDKFNNPPTKLPNFTCAKCNSRMNFETGRYGRYYRCSNYPKCDFTVNIETDRRTVAEKHDSKARYKK